jgi:hypothetical protein
LPTTLTWDGAFDAHASWQGDGHPALDRLRAALGSPPYTAYAGHCHNYRRSILDGREHIRLGSTGGVRLLDTPDGNFDHTAWVTMTAGGPRTANLLLDGVLTVQAWQCAAQGRDS